MAHWIVAKPDFDQVAEVQLDAMQSELSGQPYCFARIGAQLDDKPLENADVELQLSLSCHSAALQFLSFEEIYLEFGDLSD